MGNDPDDPGPRIRLATEDIEPGHWLAWALDLPGCFSRGSTRDEAVAGAPECIRDYYAWLAGHGHRRAARPKNALPAVEVVESFVSFISPEDAEYRVNAFFGDDGRPLTEPKVEAARRLLTWTRTDLLAGLISLTPGQPGSAGESEAYRSIVGVLRHIAGAENWYFAQLGLGLNSSQLPEDAFERLRQVRANTYARLSDLIGDPTIACVRNERWSARKVIRRSLWHERDHTQHIAALIAGL